MAPNVLEDCTLLYVRRLSLYYLTSAMIVTTANRIMMITQVTFVVIYIKNNGAYMNAYNYKITTLPYIENASNEIMEKYNMKAQYETEPPHGDAIYSISIKGKALPFWIYGRDVTFIGSSMVMVESVKCKTWNPIQTIIIDLKREVYANLKEWYTDISFINGQIELSNQVVKMDKQILNDFENLEWISY